MNMIRRNANIRGKLRELLSEHSSHKLISFEFNNNKAKMRRKKFFFNISLRKRDTYIFRQSCPSTIKSNKFFLSWRIPSLKRKVKNVEGEKSDIPITNCCRTRERDQGEKKCRRIRRERPFGMRNFFTGPIIITLSVQTEHNLKTKYYFVFDNVCKKGGRVIFSIKNRYFLFLWFFNVFGRIHWLLLKLETLNMKIFMKKLLKCI